MSALTQQLWPNVQEHGAATCRSLSDSVPDDRCSHRHARYQAPVREGALDPITIPQHPFQAFSSTGLYDTLNQMFCDEQAAAKQLQSLQRLQDTKRSIPTGIILEDPASQHRRRASKRPGTEMPGISAVFAAHLTMTPLLFHTSIPERMRARSPHRVRRDTRIRFSVAKSELKFNVMSIACMLVTIGPEHPCHMCCHCTTEARSFRQEKPDERCLHDIRRFDVEYV